MKEIFFPLLACLVVSASGWSTPYYPMRVHNTPYRRLSLQRSPQHYSYETPAYTNSYEEDEERAVQQRAKREPLDDHDDFFRDTPAEPSEDKGITGPVHTFVKTDKNANYKWGVRHHVGNKYAS